MATQEELVLKQFAAARQKLDQSKKEGQQQMQDQLNRQQAITGLSGGAAMKAQKKANRALAEGFGSAEADLSAKEAEGLRAVQSEKEAREFQMSEAEKGRTFATQERLGTQDFSSQEAGKQRTFQQEQADVDRQIQQRQFGEQIGLQKDQFQESKRQFDSQMQFQWTEFKENQRTNIINSLTALQKAGITDMRKLEAILGVLKSF